MQRKEPDRLIEEGLLEPGSAVVTVPDSGHQLHVENAHFIAIEVVGQVFGPKQKRRFEREVN